jgi:hypothetical protein
VFGLVLHPVVVQGRQMVDLEVVLTCFGYAGYGRWALGQPIRSNEETPRWFGTERVEKWKPLFPAIVSDNSEIIPTSQRAQYKKSPSLRTEIGSRQLVVIQTHEDLQTNATSPFGDWKAQVRLEAF